MTTCVSEPVLVRVDVIVTGVGVFDVVTGVSLPVVSEEGSLVGVGGSITTTITVSGCVGSVGVAVLVTVTPSVTVPVDVLVTVIGSGRELDEVVFGGTMISTRTSPPSAVLVTVTGTVTEPVTVAVTVTGFEIVLLVGGTEGSGGTMICIMVSPSFPVIVLVTGAVTEPVSVVVTKGLEVEATGSMTSTAVFPFEVVVETTDGLVLGGSMISTTTVLSPSSPSIKVLVVAGPEVPVTIFVIVVRGDAVSMMTVPPFVPLGGIVRVTGVVPVPTAVIVLVSSPSSPMKTLVVAVEHDLSLRLQLVTAVGTHFPVTRLRGHVNLSNLHCCAKRQTYRVYVIVLVVPQHETTAG